jgi:P4 family phage/plasmid primase-like protien
MTNNNTDLERTYSHREFAVGSTNKRAIFGTKQDETRLIGKKGCYISVFNHSSELLNYTESNNNSVAGYNGKVRFDFLAIDFDSITDLNESLTWTRELITKLVKEYEVNPEHLRCYFSGNKGFHLEIPNWMIDKDHQPSSQYPQIFKAIAKELTEHADLSLYQTLRLYRINNTINSKTGLYKVQLSYEEIMTLSIDEIKKLAESLRFKEVTVLDYDKVRNEKLFELFSKYQAMFPDNFVERTIRRYNNTFQKINLSGFDNILRECSYINSLVEKSERGENLNNLERVVLGNLLSRFGEEGRSKLHEILSKTPHYDRVKTDYHLDSIIKHGYNPVSCEMICGSACEKVKLLNRSSCLSLAYVKKDDKFIETYLVEKFVKYRKDIIYSVNEDIFYQYKDGVYHTISEIELASILTSFALIFNNEAGVVASRIKAAIERLKMEIKIQFKGKMNNEGFINLKNGLYDLSKRELVPHTPSVYTSIQLNFIYDENSKAPRFEKFLEEVLEDKDKINYVINTMCYLMLPDYSYQKVFIFFGSGRNGKSVLTSVITNLLGKENVSSSSIHDLANNRFSLINLKDKLMNLSSEIGSKDLETEMLKKLSGGDVITADRKYKEPLSFINTARLVINANQLPRFSELNDAILERFVLIRFPKTFRDDKVNTNLINELIEELPGIFNLVISRDLQGGGGGINYPTPESIRKDRIILLSEISSAAEFMNELGDVKEIKLLDLYNQYERFCVSRGYKQLGYRNFKKAIESAYGVTLRTEREGLFVTVNDLPF